MNKAEKILTALKEHLNIKNYRILANHLEIEKTTIYSWLKHGNIAQTGKILAKCPYISLSWLETGTGPMMIIDKDNIDLLPASKYQPEPGTFISPKLVARIEPGSDNKRQELLKKRESTVKDKGGISRPRETDDLQISEMLVMTSRVLESSTVYRSALASNVRAFYQAVLQEEEMASVVETLDEIKAENRLMAEQMDELKSMLKSLGAQAIDKKKEQING